VKEKARAALIKRGADLTTEPTPKAIEKRPHAKSVEKLRPTT
jgi:hypothetical protein